MQKELEILKHIQELYAGDTTDEEIIRFAEKNTEKVAAWKAAFAAYDLSDVLQAVDEYWNFKNNKTSPRVAQILAILNSKKEIEKDRWESVDENGAGKYSEKDWRYWIKVDVATAFMRRAWSLGKTHMARIWYDRAVKAVIDERIDRLPEARFWNYGQKVKECFERDYFNDIDNIAENIRQYEVDGKSNTIPVSQSTEDSGKWLASH